MKLLGRLLSSTRGRMGLALLIIGSGVFLMRLYLALSFYVASERILYHLPSIAPLVTMAELVAQPEDYAGNWVRVQAEVWRRSEREAVLVPPGSGPEPLGTQTNAALLPAIHLYTHNFSADRVASVSVLDLPTNQAVTVAGEFELGTPAYPQHIDAAAIHDPRQLRHDHAMNKRLMLHGSWLLLSALTGVWGAFLVMVAWRTARIG